MARIYLSSTYSDLRDERDAVYRALRRLRHDVVAMEDYVAADRRPLDKCLDDVRRCDIYIGIFGWRYGYIPPRFNHSITELEYRGAKKSGKTCLLFLADDTTRPRRLEGADAKHVLALRQSLSRSSLVSFFVSPEDLAAKATAAVANQFGDLAEAIGKLDVPLQQVLQAAKRLVDTPRLSAIEIEQEVGHLQADAMKWIEQPDGLESAQRRLDESRRLVAEGMKQEAKSASLLAVLGYVEKAQYQVSERAGDARRARAALSLAARYFRAALKLESTNPDALNGQVNVYLLTGDNDRAVTLGRYVTALYPSSAPALWDLGIALGEKIARDGPTRALLEERLEVYESLVERIPQQSGLFTARDLDDARQIVASLKKLLREHTKPKRQPARRPAAIAMRG